MLIKEINNLIDSYDFHGFKKFIETHARKPKFCFLVNLLCVTTLSIFLHFYHWYMDAAYPLLNQISEDYNSVTGMAFVSGTYMLCFSLLMIVNVNDFINTKIIRKSFSQLFPFFGTVLALCLSLFFGLEKLQLSFLSFLVALTGLLLIIITGFNSKKYLKKIKNKPLSLSLNLIYGLLTSIILSAVLFLSFCFPYPVFLLFCLFAFLLRYSPTLRV